MKWWFIFLYFIVFWPYQCRGYKFSHLESIKNQFQQNFHNHCDKYSFVEKFVRLLDHPADKYVVYVFDQPGLKNGGLGDRMAGLVAAISIALRFNRTLVIRSFSDLPKLFQPYHPLNFDRDRPKYSWDEWTIWSNYDMSWTGNDATELNVAHCVNNNNNNNLKQSDFCSFEDMVDPVQPSIVYRGNRAYLCRHGKFGGHSLVELGIVNSSYSNKVGGNGHTHNSDNLFEAAGCLIRLALWPTENLWQEVDKFYFNSQVAGGNDSSSPSSPFVQIAAHFRCGDVIYNKGQDHSRSDCLTVSINSRDNSYRSGGNPISIAHCVAALAQNHSKHSQVLPLFLPASDSIHSSQQMIDEVRNRSSAMIIMQSPSASCHIEMDGSFACLRATVTQWMIMALSKAIVVQVITSKGQEQVGLPMSGFSRFAGIYGLHCDVFISGLDCGSPVSTTIMSRMPQGNWYC